MSDVNVNPQDGSGSGGDGKTETPAEPTTQKEPTGKPAEGSDVTDNSAQGVEGAGDAVFSGNDNEGVPQFKTKEDAEKSFKNSQRYVEELKTQLAAKEAAATAQPPVPATPPQAPVGNGREVEVLKARLKMNEVFDDFSTERPDFVGKLRTVARGIIESYVGAGKSIKMEEAYHMAKGKLTAQGASEGGTQTNEELNAARIGGGGTPGGYTKDNVYQPTVKDSEILNSLPSLGQEGRDAVIKKMSQN